MGGRVRFILLLIASVFVTGAATAQELTREKFRQAYMDRVLQLEPAATVKPEAGDPLAVDVKRPGDETSYMAFLDNAYRDHLEAPEETDLIIDRHARIALGLSPDSRAEVTPARLVVLARPAQMMRDPRAATVVYRPFAGDLVEVLVIDGQDTIGYATNETLNDLGIDRDAAFALAHKNLFLRIGPVDEVTEMGITTTGAASGLATGLLVAPGFCVAGKEDVLVLIRDRNAFWSAPVSNASAVELLRTIARGAARKGYTMSETIIECRGGVWR
jgi:hypothetical protein